MPSTYAHRRFGANVLDHLPAPLREKLEAHRELYDIGLHGPDLLFYYHAEKSTPVAALGNAMHDEPGRTFFDRARRVVHEEADREAALAYALSFVCHFALDSTCHPFVEQFTRESGVTHCEIETEFDNMLLRRDGYDPLTFFTASHIHPSAENARVIAPFYKDISEQTALESLKGMITVHKVLSLEPGQALGGADRHEGAGQVRWDARPCGKPAAEPAVHREQPQAGRAVR